MSLPITQLVYQDNKRLRLSHFDSTQQTGCCKRVFVGWEMVDGEGEGAGGQLSFNSAIKQHNRVLK